MNSVVGSYDLLDYPIFHGLRSIEILFVKLF